ncbi:protein of unknown function [Cupriavidus taiwanensis]|uniref:Uncharacterized protein n=1 Tax=Cupriavidus taiwanensis TaxID=164546 RepID=A0A9Q7UTZ3_9BURK|nr:protein of unknown function [Cupriavidus taiwanensis]SPD65887.1 protein of unknown function [Cupriavidus taiwanensis]SPD66103.1 protein of unknown function [Cupriavidus taiwanensis]
MPVRLDPITSVFHLVSDRLVPRVLTQ